MTEKEAYIGNETGVHVRPAMVLVQEAMKYPCEVLLIKDEIEANCKSIMSVLGLAITSGSKLIVRAFGEREEEAVNRLVALIEADFKNQME